MAWQNQIPSRFIFRVLVFPLSLVIAAVEEENYQEIPFPFPRICFSCAMVRPPSGSDTFGEANYTVLFCEREGRDDDDEINLYSRDAL